MSRLPLEQMMASLRPLPASSSKLGTMGVLIAVSSRVPATWSDAAAGLGQAGDVGHLLGRLLGEQRELVLGRKAADGLHPPGGGGLALGGEVLAQELQDLPVLGGELDADRGGELGGQVVVPLGRVGQEALGVDVHLTSGDRGHGHATTWQQDVPVDPTEGELAPVVDSGLLQQPHRADDWQGVATREGLSVEVVVCLLYTS